MQYSSFLNGTSDDIRVLILNDESGYYVTGSDSSSKANIWKYLFAASTTSQWQQLTNFKSFAYGSLKLSDNTFFMLGTDPSNYSLQIYKLTFSSTSPDWSSRLLCPSSNWYASTSESVLVSSTIYSFFTYGNLTYLYLAKISLDNGSVTARYKSSTTCSYIYGSAYNGDYIVVSVCSNLLILNIVDNSITIKSLSGIYLYWGLTEIETGR